ncbi:MAG: family 1 encapsulin nanocompartment shell protein [Armatimonadota bacterium]|nr:family 1 encapsulin nanocompartment shell protein [Armatimonadota bacterium]
MANKFLGREDAPIEEKTWKALDEAVIRTVKAQLSGRRLLEIEGPFGLHTKSVPLEDAVIEDGKVSVYAARVLPVPLMQTTFTLSARDLAAFEKTGFAFDCKEVVDAAAAIAQAEDVLVFEGSKTLGIEGLLTAKGTASVKLSSWQDVGAAANDIIKAVTALDEAGFHGPYALALAPSLYNLLQRVYPHGNLTEAQHIQSIVGSKVIKAPALKQGGVLIASGKQFASLVLAQDLMVGFIGPTGSGFEFQLSESLVPRIKVPSSICVLKP